MGTFKCTLRISSLDGQQDLDIEATVDTGSLFTTLPAPLLRDLGIAPLGRRTFFLGDGRRVQMDVGQAWVSINGDSVITIVAFGGDDAPAVLGAYTLNGLTLVVDPTGERLIPMEAIPL